MYSDNISKHPITDTEAETYTYHLHCYCLKDFFLKQTITLSLIIKCKQQLVFLSYSES